MLIQTTSKRLIDLIEELSIDLKKDRELTNDSKLATLQGACGLAACLLSDIGDNDTIEKLQEIDKAFQLYLILVEDY